VCPGNFSAKEKKEMERVAKLVHDTLGLSHYSKSDFIVSAKRGVYFLEVNSLPNLNKGSILTNAFHSIGSSTKDFVHHVLLLTLNNK